MAQDSIRIGKAALEAFTSAIFVKSGLTREHADAWARMLVWANLRGTDSHGIIRIPRYVDLVNAKSINAKPDMRVTRKPGAAAIVLEADRAPSAVALTRLITPRRARLVPSPIRADVWATVAAACPSGSRVWVWC